MPNFFIFVCGDYCPDMFCSVIHVQMLAKKEFASNRTPECQLTKTRLSQTEVSSCVFHHWAIGDFFFK